MKTFIGASLLAAALAVAGYSAAPAYAGDHPIAKTRDPGVNKRQHNQRQRIRQGVRSGELNREEAKTLRQEQRDVRRLEREYKSDGTLTRAERRDLHKEQNAASQNIYEEKHDAETR